MTLLEKMGTRVQVGIPLTDNILRKKLKNSYKFKILIRVGY